MSANTKEEPTAGSGALVHHTLRREVNERINSLNERVVAESDGFVVIEAHGREGVYAVGADPRGRYRRQGGLSA